MCVTTLFWKEIHFYIYKRNRLANGSMSFAISTCKLWYTLVLVTQKDYLTCLKIVNEVLSIIPPYALLFDLFSNNASNESKRLYENRFYSSNTTYSQRARTAWMYVLSFRKDVINNVPLAFLVELRFCEHVYGVLISPITCAYYLMFLCYHELRRKENRDRALRLLMTVVNNPELCERHIHLSFNIAGHCLLLAGQWCRAWKMFMRSYQQSNKEENKVYKKYNSAQHYLQNIPW